MPPSISNNSLSAPPVMAKVAESPASVSDAASVRTFRTFSLIEGPAGGEGGGLVVEVLDGDRHGDRVGVGPVGDLDHDGAGVGVVTGAAAWVSKSGAEEKASTPPAPTLNRSWSTLAAFWAAVRIE